MATPTSSPPARTVLPEPPHRGPGGRWRRRLVALLVVLAVLVGVGGLAAGVLYWKLDGNISSEDVRGRLGARPRAAAGVEAGSTGPLNILMVGSDTRAGDNARYGSSIAGQRSDTVILLHLSGDRKRAVGVSIPRDTMVRIPACTTPDGRVIPERFDMFNSAYLKGGTACTIQTVEQVTGVYVDHHVVVDFAGFKQMVDALGTVPVCLPKPVDDPRSGLALPAGRHELDGEQALAYVRTRYGLGDGSDTDRIKRQQAFLAAMVQKATSTGTLANPARLVPFLDAATRAITTDPEFASLNELRKVAQSLQGIGLDNVAFVTAPTEPWPPDPNRLQLTPAANDLWQVLRTDAPLPGTKAATSTRPTPSASAVPTVQTPPQRVRVRVLNGTGQPGLATRAAGDLRRAGFSVVGVGNVGSGAYASSVVRHNPGYDESGRTLAGAVVGSRAEPAPQLSSVLELIVGQDYRGVQPVAVAGAAGTPGTTGATGVPSAASTPKPSPSFSVRTADQNPCS